MPALHVFSALRLTAACPRAIQGALNGDVGEFGAADGSVSNRYGHRFGGFFVASAQDMSIQRMDNVAIVVDDLDAAIGFFTELDMEMEGKSQIEGLWADQTVGLDGVRSDIAMMPHRTATASWS